MFRGDHSAQVTPDVGSRFDDLNYGINKRLEKGPPFFTHQACEKLKPNIGTTRFFRSTHTTGVPHITNKQTPPAQTH